MTLDVNNLSFSYHAKKPFILNELNLSFSSSQHTGITAPSGFGKSTLAYLLSGNIKPTKGEILLNQKPLPVAGVHPVALIYQHPEKAINPRWTMKKMLSECPAVDDALLLRIGIKPIWLSRYPHELSGGELQRFCVVRALSCPLSFLVADEITAMLDPITQAQIWQVILQQAAARGFGIIACSHNHALLRRVCTRIIALDQIVPKKQEKKVRL